MRLDGAQVQKFVNLDMESYRDLKITAQAFIRTLDQDEFKHYSAGMALQAYLPNSYHMLQDITAWAHKRTDAGGSPIKVRIVKGANMAMAQIESALFDWPLAPYDNKLEVDANWKRMVDFGMRPENIKAVRLGPVSQSKRRPEIRSLKIPILASTASSALFNLDIIPYFSHTRAQKGESLSPNLSDLGIIKDMQYAKTSGCPCI